MFNKDVMERLKQAWKDKSVVEISGINSYGEKFSTCGRLGSYGSSVGAFPKTGTVLVRFDKMKLDIDKTVELSIPFETKFNKNNNLIIFNISIQGETLFENPNKQEIIEKSQVYNQKVESELLSDGRDKVVDCPVVAELKKRIGQPVKFDNECGVVVAVKGCNIYNNPLVYLRKDLRVDECFVDGESCIWANNEQGELSFVVENDAYQFWHDTKFDDIHVIME